MVQIRTRAEATPSGTRYNHRHTRLFSRRKLQKLHGSFNTLRKQQRNISKISLAQRGEPRSYEQQRATGEKRGVCVGIAFRVSFVTSANDRASIISGLSIKCFNIGKKNENNTSKITDNLGKRWLSAMIILF